MLLSIDFLQTLKVLLCSLITTSFSELCNYMLVYRKEDYKILKSNIESLSKKLKKITNTGLKNKTTQKKKSNLEERLKAMNAELSMKKFKSTVLIGMVMIGAIVMLNKYFAAVVVAKLPFSPFGIVTGLSHRGLEGEDYTDCSFIFLYVLTGIVLRTNIQKILGFEGPKNAFNPFDPSMNMKME